MLTSETVKIRVVNVLIDHDMSEFFAHLDNDFEHFKISLIFVVIHCNSYMYTFKLICVINVFSIIFLNVDQKTTRFSCKGPDSTYFRFCGLCSFSCKY